MPTSPCMLEIHHDTENVIPEDYGLKHDDGDLIPETSWKTHESHWTVVLGLRGQMLHVLDTQIGIIPGVKSSL